MSERSWLKRLFSREDALKGGEQPKKEEEMITGDNKDSRLAGDKAIADKAQDYIDATAREARRMERDRILREIREKEDRKAELMKARLRDKLGGDEEHAQEKEEEIARLGRYLEGLRNDLKGS